MAMGETPMGGTKYPAGTFIPFIPIRSNVTSMAGNKNGLLISSYAWETRSF